MKRLMKKSLFLTMALVLIFLNLGNISSAEFAEDADEIKKNDWPIAKGTFIQKELVRTWDDAKWQSEFRYLKEAGMRYIILAPTAYSANGGPTRTIYPSDHFTMEEGYPDLVDNILRNAQKAGFKVFLGLNFDGDWWSKSARDPMWLNAKMEEGNEVADELYEKYHNKYKNTFYGWYWVWEVDNLNFQKIEEQKALADAININLRHVKQLNKKMPFMLCPFMNAAVGEPEAYKQMWINVFKTADFRKGDIFAPQDSVGAGGLNMDNFREWFQVLREAVDTEKGLQFWSDAETFDHSDWSSAPLDRFVEQLEGVEPYVDNIISFAYSHYYSPNVGKGVYHQTYLDYVKNGVLETVPPSTPDDLMAETDYAAAVQLRWAPSQDNIGVIGYKVYRNDVSLTSKLIQPQAYVDRTAEPETEYTYEVSAVDAAGNESERSAAQVVMTPPLQENLAKGKPYTVSEPAHDNYADSQGVELTDGIRAATTYADAAWQGRNLDEPYSITVDLGKSENILGVNAGFLQELPVGIVLPRTVSYYISEDNQNFQKIGVAEKPEDITEDTQTVEYRIVGLSNMTGRYVKIEIDAAGAWSFIDELEVR